LAPPVTLDESQTDYVAEYALRAIASRAEQGLPPTVQDQGTLELLARAMTSKPLATKSA